MASVVQVLEEDPDLGQSIDEDRIKAAQAAGTARAVRLRSGRWRPGREPDHVNEGFGLLVLSGLLSRRVGHEGRFGAELLGPTDLLRPWDRIEAESLIPFDADWNVIRSGRLAVLDRRFAMRVAPHPEVAAELMGRLVRRSRHAMLSMAIVHQPRVETRVEMMLWVLAERWATMRSGGVALSLPLTHALLADLVAASRPAVSAAVSVLTKAGRIRRDGDVWFLAGTPPGALEAIRHEASDPP
jgi:hypothetical protein